MYLFFYYIITGNKLKILNVLIGQILTYASARDIIDDNVEKMKEMKNKLRLDQWAQMKKEREFNAARYVMFVHLAIIIVSCHLTPLH